MVKTKSNQMTSKAALCLALLEGRVLNIKNCFKEIGYTNIAREIPRQIEKPFSVVVSRTPKEGTNRYGQPVTWVDYRLNQSEHNKEGIEKMKAFVKIHIPTIPKTDKEALLIKQQNLFLNL
jgi:hypothetical protein